MNKPAFELADGLPEITMERLFAAVHGREMFLMYQPQLSLTTGRCVGVEALLRWRLETGQWIPPDEFFPWIEKEGLSIEVGNQVIQMAMKASRRLAGKGFFGLRMAVNVSVSQFQDGSFANTVEQCLREYGCPPADFELEITESVAGLGEAKLFSTLEYFRSLGISVAIDDFGTGYSSLAYLSRLPANRLKIDRSFVKDLSAGTETAEAYIIKTIIGMGHFMQMEVLAEGVEGENQAAYLRELGCDEAQGFHFGRPMTEMDLVQWLSNRSF